MNLIEKLKKIPPWAWAGIGTVVGVAALFFLRRPAAAVSIAPPAEPVSSAPSPSTGGGGGPSWEPMLSAIGQLSTQVAATNEQLAKAVTQVNQSVTRVNENVSKVAEQQQSLAMATFAASRATPVAAPAQAAAAAAAAERVQVHDIAVWVDHDQVAGYITEKVAVDTASKSAQYEQGIIAAKKAFGEAEARGDKAAMDAAHAEAQRYRKAASDAGVSLGDWATRGANDYK